MAEVADIEDLNATCGFARPTTVCQLGTVDAYQKHFFMGSGHSDWEKKFPTNEAEHIVAAVTQFKSMKKGLSLCVSSPSTPTSSSDLTYSLSLFSLDHVAKRMLR